MHLPDEEVARRRQQLHEDAYFAVLKAFAKGSAPLALTKKLRKELGISDEQHKMWLEDVKAAAAAGNLLYCSIQRGRTSNRAGARLASRSAGGAVHKQEVVQHQQQQQQQQQQSDDRAMVGYKVNYFWETNRVWQEGVITDFIDNHIIITFNIGTDNEIDERVKWEQSPRLQMLPEKMDISIKRRPTR